MSSCTHLNHQPSYVFGSAIITVTIGSLGFLVALAWNAAVQKSFEICESDAEALKSKFSYAFLITSIAIVLGFLIMYFIDGDKW